jgi:hypothetical protein
LRKALIDLITREEVIEDGRNEYGTFYRVGLFNGDRPFANLRE